MSPFGEMLSCYLGGYKRPTGWLKVWLFFKGKSYRERREDIFRRMAAVRSDRLILRMASGPSFFDRFKDRKELSGGFTSVPWGKLADKS